MSTLTELLALQQRDTALDQLRHRREALPERAALAAVERRATDLRAERDEVGARLAEVTAQQDALEAETAAVTARIGEIDKRMSSGAVTAARDLVALQTEIDHLASRRNELEERTLELMEVREPLEGEVNALDSQLSSLETERAAAAAALEEAQRSIDAEIETVQDERDAARAAVPEALLVQYERLRTRLGGVGAAALVGSSCSGCHLTLPASELARIRSLPPEEVVTCEQCGRILVRT